MSTYEKRCRQIDAYCKKAVEDYDNRVDHALSVMGRQRVCLQLADWSLYDDILTAIDDYCDSHGGMEADDFDPADIIFS